MFKRILVAVDASQQVKWAVDAAAELAEETGARVALVHVVNGALAFMPELAVSEARILEELRTNGALLLQSLEDGLPEAIPHDRIAREGEPAEEIIAFAKEWDADLIVMGTHTRGILSRLLVGSTAQEVLRQAPCPVLMIRQEPYWAKARQAVAATATA